MINPIYLKETAIVSPLGSSVAENFQALLDGGTGIQKHLQFSKENEADIYAATLNDSQVKSIQVANYTKLESMFIHSIEQILLSSGLSLNDPDNLLLICTTKGNIDQLSLQPENRIPRLGLFEMCKVISTYFKAHHQPLVLSNACISGVLGIVMAADMLKLGQYKNVIVAGGDLVSHFTNSGFFALRALDTKACIPYDKNRMGINLGEAVAAVCLSSNRASAFEYISGASSNDANHISGPSRTGEGLQIAIRKTLKSYDKAIDYINAHGTGTLFNDEMEAKAFTSLGMEKIPLNSLKPYYGHTLGAAGVLETIISMEMLANSKLIPTLGYTESGVSLPLNIIEKVEKKPLKNCLKTASGFGGCNAALLIEYNG